MGNNCCVIVFVKSPEKGTVKTRLAASLGEGTALNLYRCFVRDILEMLENSRCPLAIFFYPPDSRQSIVQWLGDGYTLLPQTGQNLGERMARALETVFSQGFSSAILIGSDSPDLSNEVIEEGLASLRDCDSVIGPACDGGYYLIGFRADTFLSRAFDGISWSTPEVFMQTLAILRKANLHVHILPAWRDVDTPDDLKALFSASQGRPFAESATIKYITNNRSKLL